MVDQYGRSVNYLRLSVTDLCNLRCRYCMPENGVHRIQHKAIMSFEEIWRIVSIFAATGGNKIRITGGEPLIRKNIASMVEGIASIPGITDIAMTTNGVLLPSLAESLKRAGLKRINISIDSLNPEKYRCMSRGGNLTDVLEGIRVARDVGLCPIKLNVVLIGGFNVDEIEVFSSLTLKQDIDVRFIELMPIGETVNWSIENFVSGDIVLKKLPQLIPEINTEPSSPARYYRLPGALGRVGLIRPVSCKFCRFCNRVRLTADGHLTYCLHSNKRIDLKQVLRGGFPDEEIKALMEKFLRSKAYSHEMEIGKFTKSNMIQIGG